MTTVKCFTGVVTLGVLVRFSLYLAGVQGFLANRVELATPVTSLKRLSEGRWLKENGMSPYSGWAYHGSPLFLGLWEPLLSSPYLFIIADIFSALLLFLTAKKLRTEQNALVTRASASVPLKGNQQQLQQLRDISCFVPLAFLLSPLSLVTCLGGTTAALENLGVYFSLFWAVEGNPPMAALGWILSTHWSIYNSVLGIPILLLIINGPDQPPSLRSFQEPALGKRKLVFQFCFWSIVWAAVVVGTCRLVIGQEHFDFREMLRNTYGFVLFVDDISPNLSLNWYFFTEVFERSRHFFLFVFPAVIAALLVPTAVRLRSRPTFLAFVYLTLISLLKSYPSVADVSLYLSFFPMFYEELQGLKNSFILLFGFLYVQIMGPVMYDIWIWKGTGNANFYFAVGLIHAAVQSIMIVDTIGAVLEFDKRIKNIVSAASQEAKKSEQTVFTRNES